MPLVGITLNIKVMEIKILLPKDYLYLIRPYLTDLINKHKTQGEWKNSTNSGT